MAEAAKVYVMPCEPVPGELEDRKVYLVHDEPEPENHPAIHISIARQDSVHWVSYSKKFRVDNLRLKEKLPGAEERPPEHPFYRKFPDDNPELAFQVDSGPPRPESHDCIYEAHFKFEDGLRPILTFRSTNNWDQLGIGPTRSQCTLEGSVH